MRDTSSDELKNAPLIFVLAQVRFSAVLKMRNFIPDIQEELRSLGYTKYDEEETKQVSIGTDLKVDQSTRWIFSTKSGRASVMLTNNFVVLQTSQYTSFKEFSSSVSRIVSVLSSVVRLDDAEQIGLRYVNLIRGDGGHEPEEFLVDSLRGLSAQQLNTESPVDVRFLIHVATAKGQTLVIKSSSGTGERFLPPDLDQDSLNFDMKPIAGRYRILDIDHVYKKDTPFDQVQGILKTLHDGVSAAFQQSVTTEAINEWSKA